MPKSKPIQDDNQVKAAFAGIPLAAKIKMRIDRPANESDYLNDIAAQIFKEKNTSIINVHFSDVSDVCYIIREITMELAFMQVQSIKVVSVEIKEKEIHSKLRMNVSGHDFELVLLLKNNKDGHVFLGKYEFSDNTNFFIREVGHRILKEVGKPEKIRSKTIKRFRLDPNRTSIDRIYISSGINLIVSVPQAKNESK